MLIDISQEVKPIGGVGFNKEHTNSFFTGSQHSNRMLVILGVDYPLSKRWNVQFMYTPYYEIENAGGYINYDNTYVSASRSTSFSFLYGGLSIGYSF